MAPREVTTYRIFQVFVVWKYALVPKVALRKGIRRRIARLLSFGVARVPVGAVAVGPDRLLQTVLDFSIPAGLGLLRAVNGDGLAIQQRLDNAQRVVDGVFNGKDGRGVAGDAVWAWYPELTFTVLNMNTTPKLT